VLGVRSLRVYLFGLLLVNLLGILSSLNFAVMRALIFLVDQVSGQRKKKKQVPVRNAYARYRKSDHTEPCRFK
jgi:hypothetical protein